MTSADDKPDLRSEDRSESRIRIIVQRTIDVGRRVMIILLGGLITYILVPVVLTRYNDVKSLREQRLVRAIKFGDMNSEFVARIHTEATLLAMFVAHNERREVSGAELAAARKELQDNYRKMYLEIDARDWWWPWEFEREVDALNLLSADEERQLHEHVDAYHKSLEQTINEPISLWRFLDSPAYKVGDKTSKSEIERLSNQIDNNFKPEYEKRSELVKKIATLLANSNYRTSWRDIAGLR